MNVNWTEELVKFIVDRQFQSVSKTIIEVQEQFGIVLTEKELNNKYEKIVRGNKKSGKEKVRVHYRSFRARGIQYWFTVAKFGTGYVGSLHSEPFIIESAPTQVDLKIALRAAKISYLKDMDKLVNPEIAYRIRDQWAQGNASLGGLSKQYNVSRDVIYGIVYGHIHPSPECPKKGGGGSAGNKARGIQIEVFEGEPPKTIRGWAKDPRCRASWRAIYSRWNKGIRGPELISDQTDHSARFYFIYGEYKTIKQWVDDPRCEVSWQCLRKRIRNGHRIDGNLLKKKKK